MLHPIFDQMPARSLDDPAANRVASRQVLVVLHPISVSLEIVRSVPDSFPLLTLQTVVGCQIPHPSDHGVHFPLQQPSQTLFHPLMGLALLSPLLEEAPRHF